jgi:hypothetical protein
MRVGNGRSIVRPARGSGLAWRLALLASTAALLVASRGALAQTAPAPPPVVPEVDANGVDLVTGHFNLNVTDASLGASNSTLTLLRRYDAGWEPSFQTNGISNSGSVYTVTLDGGSETFTLLGGLIFVESGFGVHSDLKQRCIYLHP